MEDRRVVITGIGLVTPLGNTKEEFFQGLVDARRVTRPIDRFDASAYAARHAGMVEQTGAEQHFSRRLLKKLDRFSEMSLVAAHNALSDASIDIEAEDRHRMGIILGNALGGWGFAEVELRDLYNGGVREVSPYQATAWFPAAPQGQVSINYGIKGFSKTIISDIASSHLAIGYAVRAVRAGRADVVLAGGAEAPISPYALLCCNTSGETSTTGNYRPFDTGRDGYVIGEGAGILVLEEYGRAVARGARIYAEVAGFGHTSDGIDPVNPDPSGAGLARAMNIAMSASGVGPDEIDYLMPAAAGGRLYDKSESNAVNAVFSGSRGGITAGIPKSLYGNLIGASGSLDVAAACISMEKGSAPTWTGCENPEQGSEWAKGRSGCTEKIIRNVMVNSVGRGGVNACVVLRKT